MVIAVVLLELEWFWNTFTIQSVLDKVLSNFFSPSFNIVFYSEISSFMEKKNAIFWSI